MDTHKKTSKWIDYKNAYKILSGNISTITIVIVGLIVGIISFVLKDIMPETVGFISLIVAGISIMFVSIYGSTQYVRYGFFVALPIKTDSVIKSLYYIPFWSISILYAICIISMAISGQYRMIFIYLAIYLASCIVGFKMMDASDPANRETKAILVILTCAGFGFVFGIVSALGQKFLEMKSDEKFYTIIIPIILVLLIVAFIVNKFSYKKFYKTIKNA